MLLRYAKCRENALFAFLRTFELVRSFGLCRRYQLTVALVRLRSHGRFFFYQSPRPINSNGMEALLSSPERSLFYLS